jgi:hypothetical protein
MKNKLFKTCFTGLALSVAGLAHAQTTVEPVTIFTEALMSHAVISGGALNIAADSVVDGNLAAQAAVTIGAGLNTQTQSIYSGAAVTTGALSTVKNIFSGAATGIGASAHAQNVHAGAAITVGAGGDVQAVYHGAAITLGAGASSKGPTLAPTAHTDSTAEEDIHNAISMAAAIAQIGVAQVALTSLNATTAPLYTTMGGFVSLEPGIHQGSALSIAANSVVEFTAPSDSPDNNHVWVINLTEALTVGAGTVFETNVPEGDTATIIWNVGAAVTLGAGTEFIGTAFVGGAFGAATSNVSCGNIYATGAVSVGSIGSLEDGTSDPVACDTNAEGLADFRISDNEYSFLEHYAVGDVGPAGGWVFHITDGGRHGLEAAPEDIPGKKRWGCSGEEVLGASGVAIGTGASNTEAIAAHKCSINPKYGPPEHEAGLSAYDYKINGYTDWFLPSLQEFKSLYATIRSELVSNAWYSTSSQGVTHPGSQNYRVYTNRGNGNEAGKAMKLHVRAVRAF